MGIRIVAQRFHTHHNTMGASHTKYPAHQARPGPAGFPPTVYQQGSIGAPPTAYGAPPTAYGAPPTAYGAPPTAYKPSAAPAAPPAYPTAALPPQPYHHAAHVAPALGSPMPSSQQQQQPASTSKEAPPIVAVAAPSASHQPRPHINSPGQQFWSLGSEITSSTNLFRHNTATAGRAARHASGASPVAASEWVVVQPPVVVQPQSQAPVTAQAGGPPTCYRHQNTGVPAAPVLYSNQHLVQAPAEVGSASHYAQPPPRYTQVAMQV